MENHEQQLHHGGHGQELLDGSHIMELVGNDQVFTIFVDNKFKELDLDKDGNLSVKELQPAVADIGASLGVPSQRSSPDSSELLNEFTHGKQVKVSKSEFKEVLFDILLGMAAGLKRDPIVILRIDGEDLLEFINGPSFEPEMISIYSQLDGGGSLRDPILMALEKLSVDQGIPPTADSWSIDNRPGEPVPQETFLAQFKKVGERIARLLKENPVIVAHTENTFNGSGIKRLLSNKFELDKALDGTLENMPKDHHGKISKEYLHLALDLLAPSAGLPPVGAIDEMDKVVVGEAMKMMEADDVKMVKEEEFRKILAEVLGNVMLQLEGNPYLGIIELGRPRTACCWLLSPNGVDRTR